MGTPEAFGETKPISSLVKAHCRLGSASWEGIETKIVGSPGVRLRKTSKEDPQGRLKGGMSQAQMPRMRGCFLGGFCAAAWR